jgi:hypothetical protein
MSADLTDRELLELAAKAAGVEVEWRLGVREGGYYFGETGRWLEWNPLTDDGDALRLAVALNLCVNFESQPDGAEVYAFANWADDPTEADEPLGRDAGAATRRAIVRAAAEIERTKG